MENVRVVELTDEEIWLRAYCAALSNDALCSDPNWYANDAVNDFNKRFRQEE